VAAVARPSSLGTSSAPQPAAPSPSPTPINLLGGLQAAQTVKTREAVGELSQLAELHRQGALTDTEFEDAKQKLLAQM
jgi:hypothetical protein